MRSIEPRISRFHNAQARIGVWCSRTIPERRSPPMTTFHLRPYRAEDEAAAIDLWHRTWQEAYPQIDFAARLAWWRERWRNDLVPKASIVVTEQDGDLTGFVAI